MKKLKLTVMIIALVAALLFACGALAGSDPIVTEIEISPEKLSAPGTVNVTITVSNSGDTDLQDPVYLYSPSAQLVTDFGDNGSAMLKAGESQTWTGTYDVNSKTLDGGKIVYFVKYTLYSASGEAQSTNQPIRATIVKQEAEEGIKVERVVSPSVAREGQEVTVRYSITNTGTVSLKNVTIQEEKDIHKDKQTIPELKAGKTADITYTVKMGKKNLTSSASITYSTDSSSKAKKYSVEKQTIKYGEPSLEASLASSAKGVVENGTVTLTLTLKNSGTVNYTDIRVTDPALGDVFTNQELAAGDTLKLEKEVTVPETMDFHFSVTATDETGNEETVDTAPVNVTAISASDALALEVNVTADRTEVYNIPGTIRFTISVKNTGNVDAKNVKVTHGSVNIYTFPLIKAGEERSITRDTAVSTCGKIRFSASAVDPLENHLTFDGNEIQVVLYEPTPPPATPTPAPDPTPVPVFSPATMPPVSDPSIAPSAKLINKIAGPVFAVAASLLAVAAALLMASGISKFLKKKASAAAQDQLEFSDTRDYSEEADHSEDTEDEPEAVYTREEDVLADAHLPVEEEEDLGMELPHMKYAREAASALQSEEEEFIPTYGEEDLMEGTDTADEEEEHSISRRRRR